MPDLPWFVYAFPFVFIGIIVVAAIYKGRDGASRLLRMRD